VRWVVLVVGLLIAAAIAWDAAERHYDACVNAAKAVPDARDEVDRLVDEVGGGNSHAEGVARRIDGCSRLPW
jgi:hypothetical protein